MENQVTEPLRKCFNVPQPCDDAEIEALYIIRQVLEPLDGETRCRALRYLYNRTLRELRDKVIPGAGSAGDGR